MPIVPQDYMEGWERALRQEEVRILQLSLGNLGYIIYVAGIRRVEMKKAQSFVKTSHIGIY